MRFCPGGSTTRLNFHSPANFRQIVRECQRCLRMFRQPRESMRPDPSGKAWILTRVCAITTLFLYELGSLDAAEPTDFL